MISLRFSRPDRSDQSDRSGGSMSPFIVLGLLCIAMICASAGFAADDPAAAAFSKECAAKAAAADKAGTMAVKGKDGWLFFAGELRHIGAGRFWGENAAAASRAAKPEDADPLPAILDFKAQLDAAGIELLLVPVPPKAIVYPEMISDAASPGAEGLPPRLDPFHREFYEILRQNKIEVLDLVPAMIAARSDQAGAVFCKHDTHWSGRACVIAAKLIGERVKDRPWLKDRTRLELAAEERPVTIAGDLWKALGDQAIPRESLPLRFISMADGAGPVQPDRASPIVLLGDSHTLVFHAGGDDMLATGAGLADQLAMELGLAVDVMGVRGSGATPARISFFRRSQGDKQYLDAKKLVVWCFSAREFTEARGWRKVPIKPR